MNRTKQIIIEAFWVLLEEKPYNKITVKNIVDSCQINRNTFYYYFHDIPELLELTVKQDADEIIQSHHQFGSPFDCIAPLVQHLSQRQRAILHIYRSVQRDVFLDMLNRVCLYFVTQYVETTTADMAILPEDRTLLIRFYKCALVGILLDWLDEGMSYDLSASSSRLCDLFSGSGTQAFLKASLSHN